jgi:hypothetical protein
MPYYNVLNTQDPSVPQLLYQNVAAEASEECFNYWSTAATALPTSTWRVLALTSSLLLLLSSLAHH